MRASKYNVNPKIEDRTCNGIIFDSAMEMHYYRDVVLPGMEDGSIIKYEMQKDYILQPGFTLRGKRVLPIVYKADFYIVTKDGTEHVIDVKGCPDNVALLKRKMFWYTYPDIDYQWVSYVKKYGGWIEYTELKKLRKENKKLKEKEEKEKQK